MLMAELPTSPQAEAWKRKKEAEAAAAKRVA